MSTRHCKGQPLRDRRGRSSRAMVEAPRRTGLVLIFVVADEPAPLATGRDVNETSLAELALDLLILTARLFQALEAFAHCFLQSLTGGLLIEDS